jgi:formate hydrogenlyase subunit 6/NADH:ubiquinone oxidoreductase subunit I
VIALIRRVIQKALKPFTMKPPETPDGFRGRIVYDPSKCIGCGLCVRFCPSRTIKMKENRKIKLDLSECCYCYTCQEICPTKCIKLTRTPTPHSMDKKTKEWTVE